MVLVYHVRSLTWTGHKVAWAEYGWNAPLSVWLGYLSLPFSLGFVGVILFFVISGYCIHRGNLLSVQSKPFKENLGNYFWRRFIRIYPTLFFALLLTALVDHFSRQAVPESAALGDNSIETFLVNIFTLQSYLIRQYGSNYVTWSLALEEHLYLIYPLIFLVTRKMKFTHFLIIPLLVSFLTSYHLDFRPWIRYDFLPYWFAWSLGALIAERELTGLHFRKILHPSVAIVCFAIFVYSHANGYLMFCQCFAAITSYVVVLKAVESKDSLAFRNAFGKGVTYIGNISYSLYIVHVPLLVFWLNVVQKGVRSSSFVLPLAGTVFAIGVSVVFFYCVEYWSIRKPKREKVEITMDHSLPKAA